jgi:hypothetical protein
MACTSSLVINEQASIFGRFEKVELDFDFLQPAAATNKMSDNVRTG